MSELQTCRVCGYQNSPCATTCSECGMPTGTVLYLLDPFVARFRSLATCAIATLTGTVVIILSVCVRAARLRQSTFAIRDDSGPNISLVEALLMSDMLARNVRNCSYLLGALLLNICAVMILIASGPMRLNRKRTYAVTWLHAATIVLYVLWALYMYRQWM